MTTQQELTPELIRAALTTVKLPGFSRDIVSFGLVKKIDIDAENNVTIDGDREQECGYSPLHF
ncbi:MAG: iron-sulfur cluster assembly protein [Akkermansia sp.]